MRSSVTVLWSICRKQESSSNKHGYPIETGHTTFYMIIHLSSQKTLGINLRIKCPIAFAHLIYEVKDKFRNAFENVSLARVYQTTSFTGKNVEYLAKSTARSDF